MRIDPTSTFGFLGRDWKYVQWFVQNNGIAANADHIELYLNANYGTSIGISQIITIPNELISDNLYAEVTICGPFGCDGTSVKRNIRVPIKISIFYDRTSCAFFFSMFSRMYR
jgi:hypothetical protein